jgi:hypothetical protein
VKKPAASAVYRAYKSASTADRKVTDLLLNGAFCREVHAAGPEAWAAFDALRVALAANANRRFTEWLAE